MLVEGNRVKCAGLQAWCVRQRYNIFYNYKRRDSSRLHAGTRAHARICCQRVYVSLGRAHAHGAFSISRTLRWRSVQFVVVVVVVVAVIVDVVVVVVGVLVLGAFFFLLVGFVGVK